ncbi:histidine phosphatase family protein [Aeromicrobium sp. A1-2]|uniref:histidine phosphatase family protein n=1 Tax=Aeromicrobium sp. A1-2 TaxID=2107713 RepID=UPI000E4C420F|nr:histidine phosphatase family protein [Aeromicrobium sp. A1-2]AXT84399.1 histidine phosphatase family protein [Aeromicrobium sp. A1-2]
MRLILVRHGQTPANVEGVLESTVPGPGLTPLGHEQAIELVPALADHKIDALFVSSMVRTHLTAAPLVSDRALAPLERDGIREIAAGDVEGNTDDASVAQYLRTLLSWCGGDLHVRMPGAESGHEVISRFDGVVGEAESLGVESVAFVSHGAVIRAWCAARTNNVDLEFVMHRHVVNTGIVVVEGSSEAGWEVRSWLGQSIAEAAAMGIASGPFDR